MLNHMTELEYEVYEIFHRNQKKNKTLRVRFHKGDIRDEIRLAMFRNDFIKEGFSKQSIKKLEKLGYIAEHQIRHNKAARAVILYLGQEMMAHTWYKRWWQKITNFFSKFRRNKAR